MASDEEIQRILNATQTCEPHLGYHNDDVLPEDLLIIGEDGFPQCANFELRGKGYDLLGNSELGEQLDKEAELTDAQYIMQTYGISLQ